MTKTPESEPPGSEPLHVDAETFLANYAAGSELIGLGVPPPEFEQILLDGLD
jgi:hypothetical protein